MQLLPGACSVAIPCDNCCLVLMRRKYRQALRYIIRNTSLPQRTRAQAQLELSQMHCYTRPTQIRNRCVMGAKGRGVFRDFRMARVGLAWDTSISRILMTSRSSNSA